MKRGEIWTVSAAGYAGQPTPNQQQDEGRRESARG